MFINTSNSSNTINQHQFLFMAKDIFAVQIIILGLYYIIQLAICTKFWLTPGYRVYGFYLAWPGLVHIRTFAFTSIDPTINQPYIANVQIRSMFEVSIEIRSSYICSARAALIVSLIVADHTRNYAQN